MFLSRKTYIWVWVKIYEEIKDRIGIFSFQWKALTISFPLKYILFRIFESNMYFLPFEFCLETQIQSAWLYDDESVALYSVLS